jgi:hypothetical protein
MSMANRKKRKRTAADAALESGVITYGDESYEGETKHREEQRGRDEYYGRG